jgi:L,D-peptidoglycan transpeptidase YkuD (ErfK/YbiS/YcfS/YnhG family)
MGRHRQLGVLVSVGIMVLTGCGSATPKSSAVGATTSSSSTTVSTTTTEAPTPTSANPSSTSISPVTTTTLRPVATTTKPVSTTIGCAAVLPAQMAATGGGSQLVTVVANSTGSTSGIVTLWQRSGGCWTEADGPWTGDLGYNGLSIHHREGDGTTPIGVYGISSTIYGIAADPGVHGSYHQLVCGDWWDEDPTSPDYNTFQHVPCGTKPPFGGGSEALWQSTTAYQHFAFVEYNAGPIVPGNGSAIFIHDDVGGPTNGCVSLPPSDLDTFLRWLEPGQSPHIAVGTGSDIVQY